MEFSKEELSVIDNIHYGPSVSLILNLKPQIALGKEFRQRLKTSIDDIKRQLEALYPAEKYQPVMDKLNNIENEIDFDRLSESIAIYVSPFLSKVFYLDIPVDEKVIIDESFEIRDLVYAKTELQQYLLLILSGKNVKAFIGNGTHLKQVLPGVPSTIDAFEKDLGPMVANFADPVSTKEIVVNNFLRNIDEGLSNLLKENRLPVIIMGVDKILGHFKSITKNEKSIRESIHGNYMEATESELAKIVAPYIDQLKEQNNKKLFDEIEKAMNARKLSIGINEVKKAAEEKRGRVLIVEKNFVFPAKEPRTGYLREIEPQDESGFYIKDAVDDIIEKTIQQGGDVRFVDEGALKDFMQIVMIEYGSAA